MLKSKKKEIHMVNKYMVENEIAFNNFTTVSTKIQYIEDSSLICDKDK